MLAREQVTRPMQEGMLVRILSEYPVIPVNAGSTPLRALIKFLEMEVDARK